MSTGNHLICKKGDYMQRNSTKNSFPVHSALPVGWKEGWGEGKRKDDLKKEKVKQSNSGWEKRWDIVVRLPAR